MSKWTPKSVSQVLFSISKSSISIFIFSRELTRKWHLSRLLFMRLLWSHWSRSFEDFYKDSIKWSIVSGAVYGVVPFAWFSISVLFNVKNKSTRNMLNKRESKLSPVVHKTYPAVNYMNHLLAPFAFCLMSGYELISKLVK